jgi:hypothetical protein
MAVLTPAIHEYERALKPEAVALRTEICRRLGIFPPYPVGEMRTIALEDDHTSLAGGGVGWAASYLEELARKLP